MIKLLIGILLTMGAWQTAHACAAASQTRILPIGILGNDIVAMHLDMHRTDHGPDHVEGEKPKEWWWWLGRASLVAFNSSNFKISKVYATDSLAWHHLSFEKEMAQCYKKHLNIATNIQGVQLFAPQEISICDFSPNCKLAQIGYNADSSRLLIKSPDSGKSLLEISNATMKDSTSVLPFWTYDEKTMENPTLFYPLEWWEFYTISSTRLFKVGNRILLMVHLGVSNETPPPWDEEYQLFAPKPEHTPDHPKFDLLENTTYDEPVLWHGTGFDVAIWLN